MNKNILIFCASLCLVPRLVGADDMTIPQPQELTDLQSKYESNIQAAIKPIQERYRDDLETLLQRELLNGDAVAAVAVKMEILKTQPGYPFRGQWAHRDDNGGSDVVWFHPDGVFIEEYLGGKSASHWKEDAHHVATITKDDGSVFCHFFLNKAGHLQRSISGSGDLDYVLEEPNDE
jgi:hypothetical protein